MPTGTKSKGCSPTFSLNQKVTYPRFRSTGPHVRREEKHDVTMHQVIYRFNHYYDDRRLLHTDRFKSTGTDEHISDRLY